MSFMYFEGTKDFLAATPALITTFEASGSITAGKGVLFLSATDQRVYQGIAGTHSSASFPAGVALATVSNADPCPVLVWGYAKNLSVSAAVTYITAPLVISGAGYFASSGSGGTFTRYCVGKAVSGSATSCIAFINALI